MITKAPVLKFYDMHDEATIQCNASEKGLEGILLQQGQPVVFVLQSLTKTEKHYAQIEKEYLSIVFACERFNQYIHGQKTNNHAYRPQTWYRFSASPSTMATASCKNMYLK